MKGNKIRKAIVMSVIIAAASLTGTQAVYAYLADGDTKGNFFTVGKNEIVIEEPFDTPEPGAKTVKEPKAVNTGKVDCYVRGRILLSDSRAEPYITFYNEENKGLNQKDWKEGEDGWLYYQDVLKVSQTSAPVFTHIELGKDLPDSLRDFSVDIVFESVQSEGFRDVYEAFEAAGGQRK